MKNIIHLSFLMMVVFNIYHVNLVLGLDSSPFGTYVPGPYGPIVVEPEFPPPDPLPDDQLRPKAPGIFILDRTTRSISVRLIDISYYEDGYELYRRELGGGWIYITGWGAVDGGTEDFVDEGLVADTLYNYRIRAYNSFGETFTKITTVYTKVELSIWNQLPNIESSTAPAISGHTDGRLYMATVDSGGSILYTSTFTPYSWSTWSNIGTDPSFGFSADTSPVFARDGDVLYLLARGADDNLYLTTKTGSDNWSDWTLITSSSQIAGRFSVAFTRSDDTALLEAHIIYSSSYDGVEYIRFNNWVQTGLTVRWDDAIDGTIVTDGTSQLCVAIRTPDRVLIKMATRVSFWTFQTEAIRPWANLREVYDVSNVVYLGCAFHVAYTYRSLVDDVGPNYEYVLEHSRFIPGQPDNGYSRFITYYDPESDIPPKSALSVYRNKLVMAYRNDDGHISYARWDNADPTTPWIGMEMIAYGTTNHRPALAVLNHPLQTGDYANDNFGFDLFAGMTDPGTGNVYYINFSRAIFKKEIDRQFALYDWTNGVPGDRCTRPQMPVDIGQDGRPFVTELGYILWTLPNWYNNSIYQRLAEKYCVSGDWNVENTGGRIQPPCTDARLSVIIMPSGRAVFCRDSLWQARSDSYKRIYEELGHYMSIALGIGNGVPEPDSEDANFSGIPLEALQTAYYLFDEGTGSPCNATCSRCPGFTGIGCNYDIDGKEHSFIYVVYYYFSDGGYLREIVQEDLDSGDDLLLRKYNWVKDHIYRGIEFGKDNEPMCDILPLANPDQTVIGVPVVKFPEGNADKDSNATVELEHNVKIENNKDEGKDSVSPVVEVMPITEVQRK